MGGGETVILREMDVARVNPYRSGQGEAPVHVALPAPHRPAEVTDHRGRGFTSFPVDDADQARITEVIGGLG